jgi:hypothetical protein
MVKLVDSRLWASQPRQGRVVTEQGFRRRTLLVRRLFICALALVASQGHAASYRAPRTPSGAPDLQGVWTNLSLTSLQRPRGVQALTLTDDEGGALERKLVEQRAHPTGDAVGQRQSEAWPDAHLARIDGRVRTSWIVSPADGRLPYTAEGQKLVAAHEAASAMAFDGPEVRPDSERCLAASWGATGPPMLSSNYAANYQIVQTSDVVAILSEMNHDVRIVRLNGVHQPAVMRRWMGDSIGHWEKDTLVVETTNLHAGDSYNAWGLLMSADAKVIERFTRVSATQILYQFSVEDPKIFTEIWRGEMPFVATKGPIYEFACHEGNYSLPGILAGARQAEAAAQAQARR